MLTRRARLAALLSASVRSPSNTAAASAAFLIASGPRRRSSARATHPPRATPTRRRRLPPALLAGGDSGDDEPRTGWLHNTEPKHYAPSSRPAGGGTSAAMKRLLAQKMTDYRNHRIIGPPAIHPCGDRRVAVTEHRIAAPLRHLDMEAAASDADSIVAVDRVTAGYDDSDSLDRPAVDVYFAVIEPVSDSSDEGFFASLAAPSLSPRARAALYLRRGGGGGIDPSRSILYLQGGPGFGCPVPLSGLSLASSKSSWAAAALFGEMTNVDGKTFERVVLMDQRGTGRSAPIGRQRLRRMFPDLFLLDGTDESEPTSGEGSAGMQIARARVDRAVADARDHLVNFRADSIVRDAEWIREALTASDDTDPEGVGGRPGPWGAALGQSFGGFCLMTYLSSVARPPRMCLFTGGIAPMDAPAREVYDRLWPRVRERNLRYYERYPGDVAAVKRIVRRLSDDSQPPVKLPSGGILTARRFLQLGLALGGSPGSFANLHSVIGSAFVHDDEEELSGAFLKRIDYEQSFDDAPLYFLLHESIYADGPMSGATNWAAHSSYEHYASSDPEFDYRATSKSDELPTLFFGEMVFPWMSHGDFAEVSGVGMQKLSEALAAKADWAPLYDGANLRAALRGNNGGLPRSKAAAAVYYDDMYVDFDCSMKLTRRGAPLDGVKVWVTNQYQHSGLRDDGASIVCQLANMAKGSLRVPS